MSAQQINIQVQVSWNGVVMGTSSMPTAAAMREQMRSKGLWVEVGARVWYISPTSGYAFPAIVRDYHDQYEYQTQWQGMQFGVDLIERRMYTLELADFPGSVVTTDQTGLRAGDPTGAGVAPSFEDAIAEVEAAREREYQQVLAQAKETVRRIQSYTAAPRENNQYGTTSIAPSPFSAGFEFGFAHKPRDAP